MVSEHKGDWGHLDENGTLIKSEEFAELVTLALASRDGGRRLTEAEKKKYNYFTAQLVEAHNRRGRW